MVPKIENSTKVCTLDPFCVGCSSAHDCLVSIADALYSKLINKHTLYKSKSAPMPSAYPMDQLKSSPMKAIAKMLALYVTYHRQHKHTSPPTSTALETSSSTSIDKLTTTKRVHRAVHSKTGHSKAGLVIVLRHAEMMNSHLLSNLILLLNDPNLGCNVCVIAFVDALCSLPVQLSPAAQSVVCASTSSTASPWDMYDELSGRLFSSTEVPVQFTPALIRAIHVPFAEVELCITSAVHR